MTSNIYNLQLENMHNHIKGFIMSLCDNKAISNYFYLAGEWS